MKNILFLFVLLSTCAFARQNPEFMEFGLDQENSRLKGKKTNFHVKVGPVFMNYDNGHSFNGDIGNFTKDSEKLAGMDITLGYQIGVYGPISITINTTWFHYLKNKDEIDDAESGATDVTVSQFNRDYKVYGGGFSGALNYEFQAKSLIWQPFFELGGGVGKATFTIDYERFLPGEEEVYDATFRDTYTYLNSGVGINIIAASGIFAYFKASVMQFLSVKRSFKGTERLNNAGSEGPITADGTTSEVDSFSPVSYAMGMGYTF